MTHLFNVGDIVVFQTVSGDAAILNDNKCRVIDVNISDDTHPIYTVEFEKLRVSVGEFELHKDND